MIPAEGGWQEIGDDGAVNRHRRRIPVEAGDSRLTYCPICADWDLTLTRSFSAISILYGKIGRGSHFSADSQDTKPGASPHWGMKPMPGALSHGACSPHPRSNRDSASGPPEPPLQCASSDGRGWH